MIQDRLKPKSQRSETHLGEQGQVILMVGLATVVMFGIVGLAVDVGRLYVTRVELSRALDAAALSGILELNGQASGLTNAEAKALDYFDDNEPNALAVATACNGQPAAPCNGDVNTLVMDADKSISMIFLSVLGIHHATVSAHAKAGFGTTKVDIVLVMDDTGTMRSSCNGTPDDPASQTNSTCPVKNARDGANTLLDILPFGGSAQIKVAVVPFRGCYSDGNNRYNPAPFPEAAPFDVMSNYNLRGCVTQGEILGLTDVKSSVQTRVNGLSASGGYPGTNVCAGMYEGYQRLTGAGAQAGAHKIMVILTDGDQRYSDGASNSSRGNSPVPGVYDTATWPIGQTTGGVPSDCRPSNPAYNSAAGWDAPEASQRINTMDVGAYNYAVGLKAAGVEIYVLRFADPAGDLPASTLCNAGQVGPANATVPDRNPSNEARDQNISRCLATSTAGTNDHYFYAATAADIAAQFEIIANQIAHRLIE